MQMDIVMMQLKQIKPYDNNPRFNDDAVEQVANSIKEFGFKQPIVVDRNGVIVVGHTRYKAAIKLGLTEVPCLVAGDLTAKQIKAYRLADNKVAEKSSWNMELIDIELEELFGEMDMAMFGFADVTGEKIDINDLFGEATFTQREAKMVKCPHCGEQFEL